MNTPRIRDLRKQAGLTQEELAELSGISNTEISRIETGKREVSMKQATKLASALNKSPAYLLGLTESETEASFPSGLTRDVSTYEPELGDPFAKLAGPNRHLRLAQTNVLDRVGILPGTVMVINDSETALSKLKPLQAVQALYLPPGARSPIEIIRQFVPPSLLITNCSTGNLPSLDTEQDDVQIVAIIETVHRHIGDRN